MKPTAAMRLAQRSEGFVVADSKILHAFLVSSGPFHGAEGLGQLVAGLIGVLTIVGVRRWYTVVVTATDAYIIRNRGTNMPRQLLKTVPRALVGPISGSAKDRIMVDGHMYNLPLPWLDEARRACRAA